jgi:hypothetical protein
VESITETEDHLESIGGDVAQELEKADSGIFGQPLTSLESNDLRSLVPLHDPRLLQVQYVCLWSHADRHPVPTPRKHRNQDLRKKDMAKRVGQWLTTCWEACRPLLRDLPCHCIYRQIEPSYSELYGKEEYTNKEDLFIRILAHLHDSTSRAIGEDLKPSRRKVLEERM